MAPEPFSMSIKQAGAYFGFRSAEIYKLMYANRLIYGQHYLKVGKSVKIIVQAFKEWMYQESGLNYGEYQNQQTRASGH